MALWCRDLPTVTVPRVDTPKTVTLVLPFYMAHLFLTDHIQSWWNWPEDLHHFVRAIVVDDGSPKPLEKLLRCPFPVKLFRIEQDIPWNWLAARNIGAHHAEDGWLLLTDIDHLVPEDTLRSLVFGQHDPNVVYAFSRREHTGETIAPHSASFFMTREMFWRIGGYDETLSGVYGTDGLYRRRLATKAQMRVLTDALIRYEYVADSSTTQFERKTAAMAAAKAKKLLQVTKTPKTLSFPYHEVLA